MKACRFYPGLNAMKVETGVSRISRSDEGKMGLQDRRYGGCIPAAKDRCLLTIAVGLRAYRAGKEWTAPQCFGGKKILYVAEKTYSSHSAIKMGCGAKR
jgi:hypothetical protein